MNSPQNLQSSLLETMAPFVQKMTLILEDIGFVDSEDQYFELANSLCNINNFNLRASLLKKQQDIIGCCLANPNGMYRDFSKHILA